MSKWISTTQRLPDGSGVLCLVAIDVGDGEPETFPAIADFHHGKFDVYDSHIAAHPAKITHWMLFTIEMPQSGQRGVEAHTDGYRAAMDAVHTTGHSTAAQPERKEP